MTITSDTVYKVRKVLRLTQTDIGALCGVSTAFINQIERNHRNISERVRVAFIEELALTPDKLARYIAIYEETEMSAKVATSAI